MNRRRIDRKLLSLLKPRSILNTPPPRETRGSFPPVQEKTIPFIALAAHSMDQERIACINYLVDT